MLTKASLASAVFSEEHREFLRVKILKEIKTYFKDKKKLTIFYEYIKVYPYKEMNCLDIILKSQGLDDLLIIVSKKIKPYFFYYLHCNKKYKKFRNDYKKIRKCISEDRRDFDFDTYNKCMPILPFYPNTYEDYLSKIEDRGYLTSWDYFVNDCFCVNKERALSFFKPSLLTKIKEFING